MRCRSPASRTVRAYPDICAAAEGSHPQIDRVTRAHRLRCRQRLGQGCLGSDEGGNEHNLDRSRGARYRAWRPGRRVSDLGRTFPFRRGWEGAESACRRSRATEDDARVSTPRAGSSGTWESPRNRRPRARRQPSWIRSITCGPRGLPCMRSASGLLGLPPATANRFGASTSTRFGLSIESQPLP